MRTLITTAVSLLLLAALGCQSPRGGGLAGGEGFKIARPILSQQIKQGETQSMTISLNRGEHFKRDVTLDIKASPGISVEPTQVVIRGNQRPDAAIRVMAARDANLGEYKIFITGTPDEGQPTSTEITVKVVAP